jgi:hypothetical protein
MKAKTTKKKPPRPFRNFPDEIDVIRQATDPAHELSNCGGSWTASAMSGRTSAAFSRSNARSR